MHATPLVHMNITKACYIWKQPRDEYFTERGNHAFPPWHAIFVGHFRRSPVVLLAIPSDGRRSRALLLSNSVTPSDMDAFEKQHGLLEFPVRICVSGMAPLSRPDMPHRRSLN